MGSRLTHDWVYPHQHTTKEAFFSIYMKADTVTLQPKRIFNQDPQILSEYNALYYRVPKTYIIC